MPIGFIVDQVRFVLQLLFPADMEQLEAVIEPEGFVAQIAPVHVVPEAQEGAGTVV